MTAQVSQARLAANRANAQKSTGPRTAEGKATASRNATTHGLTSKSLLTPTILEGESQEDFDDLLNDYTQRFRPVDGLEARMVHNMVGIEWQLRRMRLIEESLIEMELADPMVGVMIGAPMQETTGCYKVAKAFEQLAQRGTVQLINRVLSRLNRELASAIKQFLDLRKNLPVPEEPADEPSADEPVKVQNEPNVLPWAAPPDVAIVKSVLVPDPCALTCIRG